MKTHFTNQHDTLIDRMIDNGCAFAVNLSANVLASSSNLIFRFTTSDKPVYLLSRILKSTGSKITYQVLGAPTITGTPTVTSVPVRWLNQALNKLDIPSVLCDQLSGITLSGGVILAEDSAGGPPFVGRRVLSANTVFYVVISNGDQANAQSTAELVFAELSQSTFQ